MALGREELRFVRELFSSYYRVAPIRLPKDLGMREFAFQTLDSEVYVRHLSFSTESELRAYLVVNTPKQSYYSTAKYLNPAASDFSEAGWQGSELMFDIDADKLPGCRTLMLKEGLEVVTDECIEIAKGHLERLVYVLEEHMGFGENELMVYFSGNRGFHVVVATEDPEWLGLESLLRLELVDYVTARGIDLRRLSGGRSRRGVRAEPPSPRDGGWRSLIALYSGGELSERGVERAAVVVDPQVTQDVSRLVRIPNSINGKTGLTARLLRVSELESFRLDEALSPFEGYAVVRPNVDFDGPLFGRRISIRRNVATKVDIDIALYMVLNGLARVVRSGLSSVKKMEEYYQPP